LETLFMSNNYVSFDTILIPEELIRLHEYL